jgi:hypothetical protein
MAKSANIMLAAGTITFGNAWLQQKKPNWRIPVATLGSVVVFAALESLSEGAAVGIASIVLITVLLGEPIKGVKSPANEVLALLDKKK